MQAFATVIRQMNPSWQHPTNSQLCCRGFLLCFAESLTKWGVMKKSGGRRSGEAIYIPLLQPGRTLLSLRWEEALQVQPSCCEAVFQAVIPSSVFCHSQHIGRHPSLHIQVPSTFFSLCPRPERTFSY